MVDKVAQASDFPTIPFVNLERQIEDLKDELTVAFQGVLDSRKFILGPEVSRFETRFAADLGAGFAVGCSSGTAAISLALEALGIGSGDEVITQTNSFFATAEAICHVGARPVLVDVCPTDYSIDLKLVEAAITPRTRAIVPVHLYGALADMDALRSLAAQYDLRVVEDCAQAHLAAYRGRCAGTFGDLAAFSFYPGKNLGAFGDVGAIVGGDAALEPKLKKLRNHGRTEKYLHEEIGYNHRIDELQAALLNVKLSYLPQWTARRREIAALYDKTFTAAGVKHLIPHQHSTAVYHLYVLEVDDRDGVRDRLAARGVATGIHYPVPLHQQPALQGHVSADASFPVADRTAKRLMSIPICGSMTLAEAEYVAATVLQCLPAT